MRKILGIDVGNYDTKSMHTTTPSGYAISDLLPPETDEYILWNGKYYIPTEKRFAYKMDKTVDERCLILTLFGISKEVLHRSDDLNKNEKQEKINGFSELALGAGLPPVHYASLKERTEQYYKQYMGNGISYRFGDYHFDFKLGSIKIFPQDYTAVITNKIGYKMVSDYKDGIVYAIDMGGMTVDYIPIIKGRPDMSNADSLELGMNKMYDSIIQKVTMELGHVISAINIEQVLTGGNTVLPQSARTIIEQEASRWAGNIIDELRAKGMDLWSNPAVFIGGGASLLKKFLKKNSMVENSVFIDNIHANARAYASAMREMLK